MDDFGTFKGRRTSRKLRHCGTYMLEDYLPEFQEGYMDKKINKILSKEKGAVKETKELLKMDKKQDKKIATAKKIMKKKGC